MRRFSFRLDPVLDLRKRAEDDVKRELAEKNREVLDARERLNGLDTSLHDLQSGEKERRKVSLDLVSMRATVVYRHKLKQDMLSTTAEIEWLGRQRGEIQQKLIKAVQARRAIELLREHRYALWRKETGRLQQAVSDDLSQQKFIRQRRVRNAATVSERE